MRAACKAVVLAVVGAAAYWLADAALDCLLFDRGPFWDVLVLDVSAEEALYRAAGAALVICLGLVLARQMALGRARRLEQSLRETEEDFKPLAEKATDAIFVLSPDAKTLYANKRATEMFGYRLAELQKIDVFRLIHPDDRAEVKDIFRKRMAGKPAPARYGVRGLKKNGTTFSVEISGSTTMWQGWPAEVKIIQDVTEHKQAREQLSESEERYHYLFESLTDAALLVDLQTGFILETNRAGENLLGRSREEIVGMHQSALYPSETAHECWERFRSRAETGQAAGDEAEILRKDGAVVSVQVSASAVAIQGRRLVLGLFRNITERKHVIEELRRYERAMDGFEDMVAGVDRNFRYAFANEAYLKEHQISRGDILGRTVEDLHGRELFEKEVKPRMEQCLRGERVRYEVSRTSPDGQDHFLDVTYYPLILGEQPPVGLITLIKDVTERKRQEELLHQQRHFDWGIMETAQAIIVLADTDGRVLRLNRFGQELTGYTEEEVRGKDCFEIALAEEDRAPAREAFKQLLAGDTVQGLEASILAKDGRAVLVRWYTSPLEDTNDNLVGIFAVGHDITETREKELQLSQAARMEAIGRLAGGIAHDFNNMLAVVQGHADILAKSPLAEDEASAEDILAIRDATGRGVNLVRALLAFGRRRMDKPRVIQLNHLILTMESMLRWTLGDQIGLYLKLDKGVRHVKVDAGRMEEAIVNLAINGRDAMPIGGSLSIETASRQVTKADVEADPELPRPGEYVVLSVTDNGIGMDERTRRRIFEPFFTTKADSGGTGLGLATCYGVVRQSGGQITVASEPGKGSTFRVFLPATDEPVEKQIGPVAEDDISLYPLRGEKNVLLVEDDGPMRRMLGRALRKASFNVLEAAHSQYALPLGEHFERDIHVLVTDVILPYMDGVEVAKRIKAVRPDIKVIYISGRPQAGEKIPPEAEFLAKPFTTDQLVRAIRRALADEGGS